MSLGVVAIFGVLLVVAVTTLAPRVGVAPPLLLVALGFAVSLSPWVDRVVIEPEWILAGVLPPLLYSAAVNTPAMEFRRDFRLISAFSVTLVVVSAVVVGLVISAMVPGLPLSMGIALGAIISPTDAVATSIVRRAGVSPRIVTVLEGESMLNDASALVLLRSAVAATAASVSLWQVGADFAWAVVAAVAVGYPVGRLNLLVRSRISSVPANVALSLVVPFIAYLPAEHLGASGLVAAVTAGLVTGYGTPRWLGAEDRLAERAVWRTVELLLESAVFLLVGLELPTLAADLLDSGGSLSQAVLLAVVAATLAIAIRASFVAWSVWSLARRSRRAPTVREHLSELQDRLADGKLPKLSGNAGTGKAGRRARSLAKRALQAGGDRQEQLGRWQQLVSRRLADLDYLAAERLGWREGVILVAAGMRGAVTIAAAQSLPSGNPYRSLLVLVATLVAVGTLVLQGGTLRLLAERLGLTGSNTETDPELWAALHAELASAGMQRLTSGELGADYPAELIERAKGRLEKLHGADDSDGPDASAATDLPERYLRLRLDLIGAQRAALLDIRSLGTYPSAMLDSALAQLDAEQLGLELRRP